MRPAEIRLNPPMVPSPHVAGTLVEGKRQHGAGAQVQSAGRKTFQAPFSYRPEPVFRARPDARSIHEHAEDMVVGQAICGGEIFPAETRHVLGGGRAE